MSEFTKCAPTAKCISIKEKRFSDLKYFFFNFIHSAMTKVEDIYKCKFFSSLYCINTLDRDTTFFSLTHSLDQIIRDKVDTFTMLKKSTIKW